MTTTRDSFNSWFRDVLSSLSGNTNAGFVVLITSLTLLERFLREKSGNRERDSLDDAFFSAFIRLFPNIPDVAVAKIFWKMCRHGLMHQATFRTGRGHVSVVEIGIDESADVIDYRPIGPNYSFKVSPTKFSTLILAEIDRDFASFEAPGSPEHPLPQIEIGSTAGLPGYSGYRRP